MTKSLSLISTRLLLLGSLILLLVLSSLGLHGYSISYWHKFIDQSPETEVLLGSSRTPRGDDYIIEIPIALAQISSPTPYSPVNPNIGDGQPVGVPFAVPVASWQTLFQPSSWGYFVGGDFGMAWSWWLKVLGLLVTVYLVMLRLFPGAQAAALGASMAFSLSPFVHFWSYHGLEIVVAALACWLVLVEWICASSIKNKCLCAILLGYLAGVYLCNFVYPGLVVTLNYALTALLILWWHEGRSKSAPLHFPTLILTIAVFAGAAGALWHTSGEMVRAIQDTTYPGRRISTGGSYAIWKAFVDQIYGQLPLGLLRNWGSLGNICDASSFFFYFPIIGLAIGLTTWRKWHSHLGLWSCLLAISFLLTFAVFGFPAPVAKATLMNLVLSNRILPALAILSFTLTTAWIVNTELHVTRRQQGWLILGFFGLLSFVGWKLWKSIPELSPAYLMPGIFLQTLLAGLLLHQRWRRHFYLVLVFIAAPYVLWFNPLTRGGTQYLLNNPVSRAIREIQLTHPNARWVVIANPENPTHVNRALNLSQLPRIVGAPSVGGYMCPPQKSFLGSIGIPPEDQLSNNQCGYHTLLLQTEGATRAHRVMDNVSQYDVSLGSEFFQSNKITHALLVGPLPDSARSHVEAVVFEGFGLALLQLKP